MRVGVVVVAVLLAGCGLSPEWNAWREKRQAERQRQEAAEFYDRLVLERSPEGQATLGCQFKTNAAMQGWRARSILDLEGTARANQLMEQCMSYWRQTGHLP